MEYLEKRKLQNKWDSLLINAWSKDLNMSYVVNNFFDYLETKNGYKIVGLVNCAEYLESLKMKRWCTGFNNDGSKRIAAVGSCRGFVGRCSLKMSEDLFDSPFNSIDVLLNIRKYKWTIPNRQQARINSKSKYTRRKKEDSIITIKARSLSANWETVT